MKMSDFYLEKFGFLLFLWLCASKCQTLSWTFLSMLLTKVFERIQKNTMKAKKWGKLRFHTFLGFLSGRRTIRICIARLQDKIFKKKFYLGIFFLLLWLWAANCQPLSYFFPSMLLMKVFVRAKKCNKSKKWEFYVFLFFWRFWVDVFCISDKIVEALFSKMPSTYPEKNFRGICVEKILVFDFHSVF